MTRLPSLHHVVAAAVQVALRFPLTLLCAVVVCVAGCQVVAANYYPAVLADWVFPLGSAGALGLPLTLALALAAERYGWPAAGRWLAQAGALALLAGWALLAPATPGLVWGLRLAVLLLGLHLAVAAAPYLGELRRGADTPGFWRYNQTLFQRLLLAGLYSAVLYVGCSIALLAMRELFGWDTNSDWFGYLFVGLASLFNTWFFLAGVPADFAALEQEASYPQGLKVFTQFVLLPLVVLYGGILYTYLGRIVVQWELPKGWVSGLILALAVAGIFALLLIHPLRHSPENTWICTFARWFYRALFPLLGLLAVAIGTRVRAYGLTEERYLVLLLAAWLLGIALYFLARQGQGIVWLPVSLAGLAFLSVAGPWGAFAVAERSQLRELHELAGRYHLLQNGHLDGANGRMPDLPHAVRGRLASLFSFFAERNELARLQPQFAGSLALPDSLRNHSAWDQEQWRKYRLFDLSGFEYLESYQLQQALNDTLEEKSTDYYVRNSPSYYALGQGKYWLKDVGNMMDRLDTTGRNALALPLREVPFRLVMTPAGDSLLLQQQQAAAGPWHTRLQLLLRPLADSMAQHYRQHVTSSIDLPAQPALHARAGRLQLHLYLSSLRQEQAGKQLSYSYSAEGLLEIKP